MSTDSALTNVSSPSPRVSTFRQLMIETPKITFSEQFTAKSSRITEITSAMKKSSHEHGTLQKSPYLMVNHSVNLKTARPRQPEELIAGISDFFDTKQVAQALNAAISVQDKVQVLDLINFRREELRLLGANMQFQKYKPLFLRYRSDFKKRQRSKKRNVGELSGLSSEVPSNANTPKLAQENPKYASPTTAKKTTFYRQSMVKEKLSEAAPDEYELKNNVTSMVASPTANKGHKTRLPDFQTLTKQELERELHPLRLKRVEKIKPIAYEDSPRAKILKVLPKEIVLKKQRLLAEETNRSSINFLKEKEDKRKKAIKSFSEMNINSRMNEQKIVMASKIMEADLYHFLLKNQEKEAAKELVLNPEVSTRGTIKLIEQKVGDRFFFHQRTKKKQSLIFPMSKDTSIKKEASDQAKLNLINRTSYIFEGDGTQEKYINTERSLQIGPKRELSPQKQTTLVSIQVRSSSMKNLIPVEKKSKYYIKKRYMDDDSLISYTESKLDTLYRVSTELKDNLKLTGKQVKTARTKADKHSLETFELEKKEKLKSYLE